MLQLPAYVAEDATLVFAALLLPASAKHANGRIATENSNMTAYDPIRVKGAEILIVRDVNISFINVFLSFWVNGRMALQGRVYSSLLCNV